jgi:cell division protein ZapE
MLMDRFYESLPFQDRERRHFHRFMHDVHADLKRIKSHTHPLETVAHRIASRARVLCFDELTITDIADAMILCNLFDALFRRGVTLVATSNLAPKHLYRDGLQRQRFLPAIALIEKYTDVVHMDGTVDYRLRELKKASTYKVTQKPGDANEWLSKTFTAVAGEPGTDGTVEIENRKIPCLRQSDDVVWFDFKALCDGPRSQNDYIELASYYHTLLLSDVPQFTETSENAARRFISLVDELYDRNVNLIMSAVAVPEELYRGEKLKFEFQRTVSRLMEMQSEEFLGREHKA